LNRRAFDLFRVVSVLRCPFRRRSSPCSPFFLPFKRMNFPDFSELPTSSLQRPFSPGSLGCFSQRRSSSFSVRTPPTFLSRDQVLAPRTSRSYDGLPYGKRLSERDLEKTLSFSPTFFFPFCVEGHGNFLVLLHDIPERLFLLTALSPGSQF